jgi:hypothetical protein
LPRRPADFCLYVNALAMPTVPREAAKSPATMHVKRGSSSLPIGAQQNRAH